MKLNIFFDKATSLSGEFKSNYFRFSENLILKIFFPFFLHRMNGIGCSLVYLVLATFPNDSVHYHSFIHHSRKCRYLVY